MQPDVHPSESGITDLFPSLVVIRGVGSQRGWGVQGHDRYPEPGGAVAAFGSVWVESKPGRALWRIGPDGRVLARIRGVARNPGRYGPFQTLAHGFGSIWILTRRAVVRIDPATNAPQDRIPVQSPVSIVTGLGAVWVAGGRGAARLLRIDPSDDTETIFG
jgi:hypothetical protein